MLIDSNCHPTLDGKWLHPGADDCCFEQLAKRLRTSGFSRALATGLPNVGSFEVEAYANQCRLDPIWIPVAAWTGPVEQVSIEELQRYVDLGFRMIKIHPRLLGAPLDGKSFGKFLALANSISFPVSLCCYPFRSAGTGVQGELLTVIETAMAQAPQAKLMLLHGGGVDLLRYIEFARTNPSVIVDLSFTLCKYEGSSIDLDIAFAFKKFDQRICVGSDYPEFSLEKTVSRFMEFSSSLSAEKINNIASANILKFLNLH